MEILIWIVMLAVLLAPALAVIFSKRATAARKWLWIGIMVVGYLVAEFLAGQYAKGHVNPLNPDMMEIIKAMTIELASTIVLMWLAYAGFWLHTRPRKVTKGEIP